LKRKNSPYTLKIDYYIIVSEFLFNFNGFGYKSMSDMQRDIAIRIN